jgi:hypothetical protein
MLVSVLFQGAAVLVLTHSTLESSPANVFFFCWNAEEDLGFQTLRDVICNTFARNYVMEIMNLKGSHDWSAHVYYIESQY